MRRAGLSVVITLAALIGALFIFGVRGPLLEFPYLTLALHLLFVFGTSLAVAVVSGRAYLRSGLMSVLFLGAALLIGGLATTISIWTLGHSVPPTFTPSQAIAIGHGGVLIAAALQLLAALVSWEETGRQELARRKTILAVTYASSVLLVSLVTALAALDLTPVFLTPAGPTTARLAVMAVAILFALAACGLFVRRYLQSRSPILYWYSLALGLVSLALVASAFTMRLGETMNWASRLALYLSGVYFLAALRAPEARSEAGDGLVGRWAEAFSHDRTQIAALFANLLNGVAYSRIVTNTDGEPIDYMYLDVNDAFASIVGLPKERIVGRRVTDLVPGIERDPADVIGTFARVAATGEPVIFEWFLQATNRWYHVSAYRPEQGCFASIVEDITERKQMEAALKAARDAAEEARARAERASQAKDHFLAVLSHELRTPLSPVVTGLALLEAESGLSARGREIVEVARRNIDLESRLIDDLLDLARITRGQTEIDRREMELCTVIDRAVEVCSPDIEARSLQFGVDFGPARPYVVNGDAARLQQVFWNLLKNAIKFTPQGGCLGIRCRPEAGMVVVEVNDSGIGIHRSEMPMIFDAFAQAERAVKRRFGGLGLGLTIAKALIEMHGGTIDVRSEGEARGTTFSVRLPIVTRSDAARSPAAQTIQATGETAGRTKLRVLLVEDHGDTAEMLTAILTGEGHDVVAAADVATALAAAGDDGRFDLLISDLGLPDRSGLELMCELRSRGNGLPGIALSGYGQDRDVEQSRAAGFGAHLVKPADPRVLLATMDRIARETGPAGLSDQTPRRQ